MRRSTMTLLGAAVATGTIGVAAVVAAPSSARPAAERVPHSVDVVRILYRDTANTDENQTIRLHGKKADRLINLFNDLKREPRDAMHCLALGSASTHVVFRNDNHRWVTTQSICTGVGVTRDGKSLPTLVPSRGWNLALTHHLGHSPTGTGTDAPR